MRIEEIEYMPTSGLDDTGRVFRWQGEIYRGIFPAYAKFYREIFGGSLGKDLLQAGIVQTEITAYRLEGFDLILRHKTIPFISYPVEWSSAMLKDAALLTCDIQLKLLKNRYLLKDGHPYNILFEGCDAKFVDVGSIALQHPPASEHFLKEFRNDFVYPLLLKSAELPEIIDATHLSLLGLPDKLSDFNFLFFRLLLFRMPIRKWIYHAKQYRAVKRVWGRSPIKGIERLRRELECIPPNSLNKADYGKSADFPTHKADEGLSAKIRVFQEVVQSLKPRSILNLFSNRGLYSFISLVSGAHIINCDTDDHSLNLAYYRGKEKSIDILPIKLDLGNPTLSYGPWGLCRPAQERFKCDLVTLFDITPNIIFDRRITFNEIASYLKSFCLKWVLVEYVGYNEIVPIYRKHIKKSDYTLGAFQRSLEKHFHRISVIGRSGRDRWLILCSRNG